MALGSRSGLADEACAKRPFGSTCLATCAHQPAEGVAEFEILRARASGSPHGTVRTAERVECLVTRATSVAPASQCSEVGLPRGPRISGQRFRGEMLQEQRVARRRGDQAVGVEEVRTHQRIGNALDCPPQWADRDVIARCILPPCDRRASRRSSRAAQRRGTGAVVHREAASTRSFSDGLAQGKSTGSTMTGPRIARVSRRRRMPQVESAGLAMRQTRSPGACGSSGARPDGR